MEYHKIETIFDRNPDFTVDVNKLRKPVIRTINPYDKKKARVILKLKTRDFRPGRAKD